jgi:uncharacterized damage-inducible protein DinB
MTRSTLDDAFGHHVWASLRLMDACLPLTEEQLATAVPGTYGTILDTMRHLVGADASYLYVLSGETAEQIDEDSMEMAQLRATMAGYGAAWASVLTQRTDAEQVLTRHRDDGSSTQASVGIRLSQALHHGTDHRSQICTALTTLGIEPPSIDVWDYAWDEGRLVETEPAT